MIEQLVYEFIFKFVGIVVFVLGGQGSMDLIQLGMYKGCVFKQFGEQLGILLDEMLVFGDGINDFEMFYYVIYVVVM